MLPTMNLTLLVSPPKLSHSQQTLPMLFDHALVCLHDPWTPQCATISPVKSHSFHYPLIHFCHTLLTTLTSLLLTTWSFYTKYTLLYSHPGSLPQHRFFFILYPIDPTYTTNISEKVPSYSSYSGFIIFISRWCLASSEVNTNILKISFIYCHTAFRLTFPSFQ